MIVSSYKLVQSSVYHWLTCTHEGKLLHNEWLTDKEPYNGTNRRYIFYRIVSIEVRRTYCNVQLGDKLKLK